MRLLLYHTQTCLSILIRLSAFSRVFVAVQGGKNLAPRLLSSTSLSPCIGSWLEYILTFWAGRPVVGLVDLLTSLRNFVYFTLFFMEMGGWGARSTDPTGIYHIISYQNGSNAWTKLSFFLNFLDQNMFSDFLISITTNLAAARRLKKKLPFCKLLTSFS